MDNVLDFDVQEITNENGIPSIKYLINNKEVSKDTWNKLKLDNKEKVLNALSNNNKNNNVSEPISEEYEFNDEELILLDFINDLRECDDKEALDSLNDFLDESEDEFYKDGYADGFTEGIRSILRQFTEEMNQIIYGNLEVQFVDEDSKEFEDREFEDE